MSLNVELLEQSFELVKPRSDEFVASFYNNLFTDYPASKPLFAHTEMSKQQQMLKGALVMVIENLRQPDVLSKALKGLGARHVKYGALPEHYPLVGNSLIKTLSQYAGNAWTPELKDAWVGAYDAITELMLDGADYSAQSVQLEAPTATAPTATAVPTAVPISVPTEAPAPAAAVSVPTSSVAPASPIATAEATAGISNQTAAGIIGGGTAALLLLLLIAL